MALSPEYLQGLPEELENLALQFEADIIADISSRIAKAGSITDTAEYEMMLLKEMGAATDYLEKLTAQYLGVSDQVVSDMVFDAAQTDSDFYETVYAKANRDYMPFEYNDYLQRLADAAVNQTCGELENFTRSMGFSARGSDGRLYFTSAAKTYRSAMDKAFFYAAAGMDYQTAVRRATREITASGLQFVDYASGVRNHVDVAVRRALLTGVSQMTGEISLHNAGELDTDVVEVSAHAGARPDHAEWQGRWYSLTGKDRRYPLLADVTGYGSVEGLKGANCRHDFYPVIPDVSVPAYTDEQLKNIDPEPVEIDGKTYTLYEAQQKQRAYERAIRKTKREIIAADASGDSDMFAAKSVLLRRQKAAYGKFSKEAGLLPRIERTGVVEYGRSISAKAVWADRKKGNSSSGTSGKGVFENIKNALTKYDYSDIIREEAARPANEPEILKQFRYVGEGAYTQEEKLKIANPNRLFDTAYTENCQKVVICGELLDRGYDVSALPYVANDAIGSNGLACWEGMSDHWYMNKDLVMTTKADFISDIKKSMSEWGEGSRAQIHIEWENNSDGHFITAKYINGEVEFYDYQSGEIVNIKKYMKKWDEDPENGPWFVRIDNKEFNENVIFAAKSRG